MLPASVMKALWKISILGLLCSSLRPPVWAQQATGANAANANDIRKLSQDFTQTSGDITPWVFCPQSNIQSLSTSEHRGLLTIRDAGKGQDVKGVLKDPIPISQYPLPWEFQLGLDRKSVV